MKQQKKSQTSIDKMILENVKYYENSGVTMLR